MSAVLVLCVCVPLGQLNTVTHNDDRAFPVINCKLVEQIQLIDELGNSSTHLCTLFGHR